MKKISKFGIILGVALLTINVHAGDVDFTLNVKEEQGKKVAFTLDKMKKVDLSIYDLEGNVIYSEKVNPQKNINKTFDLKAFPEGTYFLETESETKIARYEIIVNKETATLSANATSELYKPVFVNKDGLVRVSFLNMDKSPVNIIVYDKENNEVYSSDVILDQNVAKVFDVKNITDEEYTFVMIYRGKNYSQTFASR